MPFGLPVRDDVSEASSVPGAALVPEAGWHTKDGVVNFEEHMAQWKRLKTKPIDVERCAELKAIDELKTVKDKHVLFTEEAELIEFIPECMVMAMPDGPAQAERAKENLESRRTQIWEDIQGVPREIINEHGEKTQYRI